MKPIRLLSILTIFLFWLTACQKQNYLIGGSLHQAKVNMTTYDYLKTQPYHLFDTLVILIDAAGVKNVINQPGITFFAPTDYSIHLYLEKMTAYEQNIDPARKYTLDSMLKYDLDKFRDSINAYVVHTPLNYDQLKPQGTMFPTAKDSTWAVVSYEPTHNKQLGYYNAVSTPPSVVYYTLLKHPISGYFDAQKFTSSDGVKVLCQTFGILTTTGTLGVLNNGYILFNHPK